MSNRGLYDYSDIIPPSHARWEHDTDDEEYVQVTLQVARNAGARRGTPGGDMWRAWQKGFFKGLSNGKGKGMKGGKGLNEELMRENEELHCQIRGLENELRQSHVALALAQRNLLSTTRSSEELRGMLHNVQNQLFQSQGSLFPAVHDDLHAAVSLDEDTSDPAAEVHSAAGQEESTSAHVLSPVSSASEVVFPDNRDLFAVLEPESPSSGKAKSKGKGSCTGGKTTRFQEPTDLSQATGQGDGISPSDDPSPAQEWLTAGAQSKAQNKSSKQPASHSCSSADTVFGRPASDVTLIHGNREIPLKLFQRDPPPTDHSLKYTCSLDENRLQHLRSVAKHYSFAQCEFYVCNGSPEAANTCWFEPLPENVVQTIWQEFIRPLAVLDDAPLIVAVEVDKHSFVYHMDAMVQVDIYTGMCRPIMLVDLSDEDNCPVNAAHASSLPPDCIPSNASCAISQHTALNLKYVFAWWKEEGHITDPCLSNGKPSATNTHEHEDSAVTNPRTERVTYPLAKVSSLPESARRHRRWVAETYNPEHHKFFVIAGDRKKKKNTLYFTELAEDAATTIERVFFDQLREDYDIPYVILWEFGDIMYEYDMVAMTQRNPNTRKVRPIVLVDMETNAHNIGLSNHSGRLDAGLFASDTACMVSGRVVNDMLENFK